MKFAFSTLGCPDWTFKEMISTAKDLGLDGIEIRGIEKQVFAPYAKPFYSENIQNTLETLKSKNLEISCLSTGACLGSSNHIESALGEATVYTDLAEKLGVKYIRVMISNKPFPENSDFELCVECYKQICEYAKGKNVIPLIETNGILADTFNMKRFMEQVNCENAGVLWDIHHPYRFFHETPAQTYENIKPYLKYVHIKDSVIENNNVKYKMLGKGDVPVAEVLNILKDNSFDGFVTLEWVKRWCPELEEAGIVFSHFVNYIKKFI